jgi:MoaA/NifB/PqqE/SkfB family radical SAM enzyme
MTNNLKIKRHRGGCPVMKFIFSGVKMNKIVEHSSLQTKFNLGQYLSEGIETLVKNAVRATLKNPKESAFLLKYIASAKKAGKKRMTAEKRGEHIPPFLIASVTGKCNLKCEGCYSQAMPCKQSELDAPEWERIFAEAKELGVSMILLAGGEPFMRPDVISKAAGFPEILFPIFTNGTLLKENDYSMLNSYRNLAPMISVEGGEAMTDSRRGPGVYANLTDTMRELDNRGVLFGASVTVTNENLTQVTDDSFVDDLYNRGCKIILYVEYVPFESESLAFTDKERAVLENRVAELRKKEMIFISFPGDEKETGGCLAAGRGFFHISAGGDAEPCPFSPYSDTNLRNIPLRDALQSPLFKKITASDILLGEHKGGCVLFEQKEIVSSLSVTKK